jgi:hypothetical protein
MQPYPATVPGYACSSDIAACRTGFDSSDANLAAGRDPRSPPSARRSPEEQEKTSPAPGHGPAPVDCPLSPLARLAQDNPAGQTRDGHRMAPKGIPTLLKLEKSPATRRPPGDTEGGRLADSRDELVDRNLGSAPSARGAAQAWDQGVSGHGGQVFGEAPQATIAAVADVSGEPCLGVGFGGLLRGADREFPDPVRVSRLSSPTQARRVSRACSAMPEAKRVSSPVVDSPLQQGKSIVNLR